MFCTILYFLTADFDVHGKEIYNQSNGQPIRCFMFCTPSVTDETVAPEGCENMFFLIPVAAGLQGDTEELREIF